MLVRRQRFHGGKIMKIKIIGMAVLMGTLALTASATTVVVYNTVGDFTSTGTTTDGPFTYLPSGVSNVLDPYPTAANFGSFNATGMPGTPTDSFVLTINQLVPHAGSSTLTSQSFTGSVASNSSNVLLSFAGDGPVIDYLGTNYITFGIAGVEYGLQENTVLSPHTTNDGLTTLNGLILGTPEPGSWLMVGTGVLAVLAGALGRKKRLVATA
jgi:hypothetical protein